MDLNEIMAAVAAKVSIDFERVTKQISHPGEKGAAREDVLIEFLRDYLPDRIGVSSGFVVDHEGNVSPQCDVILFDKQSAPVFKISDTVRLLPAETVFETIEVKSSLDARELDDATSKFEKIVALSKSAEPSEAMLGGYSLSHLFKGAISHKPGWIPSGIFAFESQSLHSLGKHLVDGLVQRRAWPRYVISLRDGSLLWGRDDGSGATDLAFGASKQTRGILIDPTVNSPLSVLYMMVMNFAQGVLSSRPHMHTHLNLAEEHNTFELGEDIRG